MDTHCINIIALRGKKVLIVKHPVWALGRHFEPRELSRDTVFDETPESLKFPVIQQRCDQYHKAGTCIVHQRTSDRREHLQQGKYNCHKVDAHGQRDTELDGLYRSVG